MIVVRCVRDIANIDELDLGLWIRGVTPNFHTQTNISPFAVNQPIACGGTLVMPGDIVIADDDGAVVVPKQMAPELVRVAKSHTDWEVFAKEMLEQGGHLKNYYPISLEAWPEYQAWRKERGMPPAELLPRLVELKKERAKKKRSG